MGVKAIRVVPLLSLFVLGLTACADDSPTTTPWTTAAPDSSLAADLDAARARWAAAAIDDYELHEEQFCLCPDEQWVESVTVDDVVVVKRIGAGAETYAAEQSYGTVDALFDRVEQFIAPSSDPASGPVVEVEYDPVHGVPVSMTSDSVDREDDELTITVDFRPIEVGASAVTVGGFDDEPLLRRAEPGPIVPSGTPVSVVVASGNWVEGQAERELGTQVVFGELCSGAADAVACEDRFAGTLAAATSTPPTIADPSCGNCIPEFIYVVVEHGDEFTVVAPEALAELLGPVDTAGEVVLLHGNARVRSTAAGFEMLRSDDLLDCAPFVTRHTFSSVAADGSATELEHQYTVDMSCA